MSASWVAHPRVERRAYWRYVWLMLDTLATAKKVREAGFNEMQDEAVIGFANSGGFAGHFQAGNAR
jgi:hypothetical protein